MNNKGADQTARMRRLVCACVVRKPPETGFRGQIIDIPYEKLAVVVKLKCVTIARNIKYV